MGNNDFWQRYRITTYPHHFYTTINIFTHAKNTCLYSRHLKSNYLAKIITHPISSLCKLASCKQKQIKQATLNKAPINKAKRTILFFFLYQTDKKK